MTSSQIHIVDHPLIRDKLTHLRNKDTPSQQFRQLISEIATLLYYPATHHLPTQSCHVTTPMAEDYSGQILTTPSPVIIPILRAGLTMVNAFLTLIPDAKVGHIGLKRDETTHQSHCYYAHIPSDSENRPIFICDPMLATGGSAINAINLLKDKGLSNITLVCIISAVDGVQRVTHHHPDITLFTAEIDPKLDANAFILPGLGDAGDRAFGAEK